jgi:predicted DNA-binding protein with PD1-like motif
MDILAKIKEFVKAHEVDIILAMAVALISLLSFAIGYLTAKEQLKEPLRIESRSEISDGSSTAEVLR